MCARVDLMVVGSTPLPAVARTPSRGSVYFFGNNQDLVGKHDPNKEITAKYAEYKDFQAGFRLGGPIIKNKLFFFINGEITRQKTPLAFAPEQILHPLLRQPKWTRS